MEQAEGTVGMRIPRGRMQDDAPHPSGSVRCRCDRGDADGVAPRRSGAFVPGVLPTEYRLVLHTTFYPLRNGQGIEWT